MNAPRRLLEEGGTPLEMSLLRSAKDDGPSPEALKRAMVAVGIGGGVLGVGAGASTAAAGAVLKPTSGLMKWFFEFVLWASLGIAGGILFTDGPGSLGSPQAQTRAPGEIAIVPGASTPEAVAPIGASHPRQYEAVAMGNPRTAEPTAGEDAKPRTGDKTPDIVAMGPRATGRPAAQVRGAEAARPTLAEEVNLIDSAKRALNEGNSAAALQALERHTQRFEGGSLKPEAAVLRIEVMAARGELEGAAAAARAFLVAHPRHPHANKVRELLRRAAPTETAETAETTESRSTATQQTAPAP